MAAIMAEVLTRKASKHIKYWAKIGKTMGDSLGLPYEPVKQVIIANAEKEAGRLEAYEFG